MPLVEAVQESRRAAPVVVWRLLDGKSGHENQTLGLANALAELMPLSVHDLPVVGGWRAWLALLLGRCAQGAALPDPDLIIGAGHATHVDMLACRRARGGRAVVLMRPSLPRRWFDLCVIPAHDGVGPSAGVLISQGALNHLRPSEEKASDIGLILVGGPSSHHGWDQAALCDQVGAISVADPRRWTVATSRRTPAATLAALQALALDNLTIVPSANTAPGWLAIQLAPTPLVWVTEDSVSMLYEALTAGAACGVLPVPRVRAGRVSAGVEALLKGGTVTSFADWQGGQPLVPPKTHFDEAARCARWIRQQWFAR